MMESDAGNEEPGHARFKEKYDGPGLVGGFLLFLSYLVIVVFFPLSLCYTLKVVAEYERLVIFRLGRLLPCGAIGPGIIFIVPCVDEVRTYDLRVVCSDLKPQNILSKDCVNVSVDAVVYSRIFDPNSSICYITRPHRSICTWTANTLRKVLGKKDLSDIITDRQKLAKTTKEKINNSIQHSGIKVERIEIKEIKVPSDMIRTMAAEAAETRHARAKLISAEGEQNASRALKEAADRLGQSPASIQLRYIQSIQRISAKNSSTIVLPLPNELLESLT